jgi:hypothetical protein
MDDSSVLTGRHLSGSRAISSARHGVMVPWTVLALVDIFLNNRNSRTRQGRILTSLLYMRSSSFIVGGSLV